MMYDKQVHHLISYVIKFMGYRETDSKETVIKLEQIEDVLNDLYANKIWNT